MGWEGRGQRRSGKTGSLSAPPFGRGELGQAFPDNRGPSCPGQVTRPVDLFLEAGEDISHRVGALSVAPVAEVPEATSDIRPQPPIGGHLGLFADCWEDITMDAWFREMIQSGLSLEFLTPPPRFFLCCPISVDPVKWELMEVAIQFLLDIRDIQLALPDQQGLGFYSVLFVIPKTSGCVCGGLF